MLAEDPGGVAERVGELLVSERRVEGGRKERPRAHFAEGNELWHVEDTRLDCALRIVVPHVERSPCDDRVRRAEVDADGETRGHGVFVAPSTARPGIMRPGKANTPRP